MSHVFFDKDVHALFGRICKIQSCLAHEYINESRPGNENINKHINELFPALDIQVVIYCIHINESYHARNGVMSTNEYINESWLTKDVHALICSIHMSESGHEHKGVMSTNE